MATPAQAKQRAVRYAVHTEAASLFKFLTATFSQMPRPVQVVGWFVFLLLFVYLVLSPVVGITYYEGRIMQLSFDPKTGEPSNPSPMSEITVTHDHSVLTNKQGEFTFAGRWPYIPFNPVKFWIDPGVLGEDVSIPTPGPLVSMFNPNRQTIYFVPSSRAKGAEGFPQHFFLDSKAANDARDSSRLPNVPQSAPATPAALNPGQRPSLLPVVYAAASNHTERNYTLRLREAKVSGLGREAQVYFDIRIDGQPFRSPNLPDSNSFDSRDLTVLADTPLRFDSLYFPVPEYARRVDISMIERKSFVQRDPLIGTVSLSLDANKTGPYPGLRGGNLELTLELLPPASVRCLAVPGKRKNYIAAVWLDIAEEHLKEVSKLQYDRGSNWGEAVRYVDSSDIYSGLDPFDHYTDLISIFASQPVRTSVDFASGSKITFATFCDVGSNAAGSPTDSYYRSLAYYSTYDFNTVSFAKTSAGRDSSSM